MLSLKMPDDMAEQLALRLRERRLEQNWSREELAHRSGVSTASIKRFELNGEIALKRLLALCFVLHDLDAFDQILKPSRIQSIADIEKRSKQKRLRGRKQKK